MDSGGPEQLKKYTFAYFRVRDKKLHPVKTPEFSNLRFLNENIENTSGGAGARTYDVQTKSHLY